MNPSVAERRGVPFWAQVVILGLLVGLLVVVGLGLARAQQGTAQPDDHMPNFKLHLYSGYEYDGGSTVELSDLAGKVVVLNFWASWCKPCELEAADLQRAWKYYEPSGRVIFLGADYVDTEPEARAYLKKFAIGFPNGPDLGTKVSQLFRIKGVPETYIIGADGTIQYVQVGPFISVEQIQAILDPLLP